MYNHDFLAVCKNGHKRNFIWHDESSEPLITVKEKCFACNGQSTFTIKKYWAAIYKLPEKE